MKCFHDIRRFKAEVKPKWNKLKIVRPKLKLLQLFEGCRQPISAQENVTSLADLIVDEAEELIGISVKS